MRKEFKVITNFPISIIRALLTVPVDALIEVKGVEMTYETIKQRVWNMSREQQEERLTELDKKLGFTRLESLDGRDPEPISIEDWQERGFLMQTLKIRPPV